MIQPRFSDFEVTCLEQTIAVELGLPLADQDALHASIIELNASGGLDKGAPAVDALKGQTRIGVLNCRRSNLLGAVELWRIAQAERAHGGGG